MVYSDRSEEKISCATAGSAEPFDSFIIFPMKNWMSCVLPFLYFSTSSGLFSIIFRAIVSSVDVSETCCNPCASTMLLGSSPEVIICLSTLTAVDEFTALFDTSAISSAKFSGVSFDSVRFMFCSFNTPSNLDVIQLPAR